MMMEKIVTGCKSPGVYTLALLILYVCLSVSCNKDSKGPGYEWEWDDKDTTVPASEKPIVLWIDAAANFPDFANSKENIRRDLKLAKNTGFTTIVVDVRPTSGDVLFQTDTEEQVRWLGAWLSSGYTRIERHADWDYLEAFTDIAGELGLEVYASINTFTGGNNTPAGTAGMLYREENKKVWATELLTENGIVNTMEINNSGARFLNPVNEEVQEYICAMLHDLAGYEGLKGILLDRGRFNNLYSDFSDYTREKFEAYLGESLSDFPASVMTPDIQAGNLPGELPKYFKPWMEFRAKTIRDFMEKARNTVKAVNNDLDFGVYVGGWYSTYYEVGVNWASPEYATSRHYPQWAGPKYGDYGYADLMDIILIGAYAAPDRVYGSAEWTVEGFCSRAVDLIKDEAVIIGGTDVGNGAWADSDIRTAKEGISNSVSVCTKVTDGYFLFDLIHLKLLPEKWEAVAEGVNRLGE